MYLEKINSPSDLRALPPEDLDKVAAEIREEILDVVSANGGHLGASLGTVELILALHYVFDTPREKILFDVGHQAYAHKLLTGRREFFRTLRQFGGCAGFPSRAEDPEADPLMEGHAGCAISAAVGMAAALQRKNSTDKVVAVVGDGSLNCGISLEGLNNARCGGKNLVVVLNDNKMSISKNVGGLTGGGVGQEFVSAAGGGVRNARIPLHRADSRSFDAGTSPGAGAGEGLRRTVAHSRDYGEGARV